MAETEMSNTIRSAIEHQAQTRPTQPFLIAPHPDQSDSARTLDFKTLATNTAAISAVLNRLGVPRGAKIAFLLDNGYWTAQLFLGVMAAGRVIVPLNAVAGTRQLEHVLGHSDAEVVLVSEPYRERLEALAATTGRHIALIPVDAQSGPQWPVSVTHDGAERDAVNAGALAADDPALLLYTSGSTGLPKGAILSHRAIVAGGQNVALGHDLKPEDRVLCVLPVYHINGAMVTVTAPLVSGSSLVMPTKFSASQFWSLIETYQCTWSSIVPTIIKYLLDRADKEPYSFGNDPRLASFRFGRSASAPLPAVVLAQWEERFGVPMIETLGLTETAGTVASNPMPPARSKAGSVGLAVGNEIRVMDEDGSECPANKPGEIVIRGDNVLKEYYKNPEATASGFTDGWFRTGDLGKKDEEGYIFITGRLKELIIRGGENIAPREIDDVLYKHDAILEAAAVGVDDDNYGQEVVACVVVRDGYSCTAEELQAFCAEAVGEIKKPKIIYFMDDLPKGPSGKILRLQLPDMIAKL